MIKKVVRVGTRRFYATIVFTRQDIRGADIRNRLSAAMDAVENAIASVPGAAAIDICYFGSRDRRGLRVKVRPHGTSLGSLVDDDWDLPLQRRLEDLARQAIAAIN